MSMYENHVGIASFKTGPVVRDQCLHSMMCVYDASSHKRIHACVYAHIHLCI